jgi:Zn-dependent peptidase ImmA (M78 family)
VRIGIEAAKLKEWATGTSQPNLTQTRELARILKRPLATFLLPTPPQEKALKVEFRHAPGAARTEPDAKEKVFLREVFRIQEGVSWILQELGQSGVHLPQMSIEVDPATAAAEARALIGVSASTQLSWRDEGEALRAWRQCMETTGIGVFLLPMGRESARGFSLWDDHAPVIAANTHWNTTARIYTLFHEFGHLLTRTSSLCLSGGAYRAVRGDQLERWCERFAASTLLPWEAVKSLLEQSEGWTPGEPIEDLSLPSIIARRFKTSLRAAVLFFVGRGLAEWSLYDSIPKVADDKRAGGGGSGRSRSEIRLHEYGSRTAEVFVSALREDILGRPEVANYLQVNDEDIDQIADSLQGRG